MDVLQTEVRGKSMREVSNRVSGSNRQTKGRTYVYTPGSLWSHLKYGLGTLGVLVIPPLIPGATAQGLIMGYISVLGVIFTIICVWGMVRNLHPPGGRR
jgi:hypothetical protein